MAVDDTQAILLATRTWLERAVIGLNLCPFARTVHLNDRIRYSVSDARSPEGLLRDFVRELLALKSADPERCETTLLIHPHVMSDFLDYNDFLDAAAAAVAALRLTEEFQVASFHPRYQFAGTQPDDIENYTNRSPFPMLHLLRESSVDRGAATAADAADISDRNIATLRRLGHEGWRRLWLDE